MYRLISKPNQIFFLENDIKCSKPDRLIDSEFMFVWQERFFDDIIYVTFFNESILFGRQYFTVKKVALIAIWKIKINHRIPNIHAAFQNLKLAYFNLIYIFLLWAQTWSWKKNKNLLTLRQCHCDFCWYKYTTVASRWQIVIYKYTSLSKQKVPKN